MPTAILMLLLIMAVLIAPLLMPAALAASSSSSGSLAGTSAITLSMVNQVPDPALVGGIVDVRLGVQNSGGVPIDDLLVELLPEYPFVLVPGSSAIQSTGAIKGYQYNDNIKILKYSMLVDNSAPAGSYDLKVKYYQNSSSASTVRNFSVDVEGQQIAEVIYIDQTSLLPGMLTTMKFVINNVGNTPLQDVTFRWANADDIILPVGSDNTKHIKSIPIGESAEVAYQVIADRNAVAGLYKMDLTFTYRDPTSGATQEMDSIAGIYVGGGTDFDVSFSESASGSTSFSIANIGSNPAYSVAVRIPLQPSWTVTGSDAAILGNLNTGDYTIASFTLSGGRQRGAFAGTTGTSTTSIAPQSADSATTDPSAQGARAFARADMGDVNSSMTAAVASGSSIRVQIDYTDTMGQRHSVIKEVPMNTASSANSTGSAAAMAAAGSFGTRGRVVQQQTFLQEYKWHLFIVLLVIGALWYRGHRKKKLLASLQSKSAQKK